MKKIYTSFLVVLTMLASLSIQAQISGIVYRDYNSNGSPSGGDIGLPNMDITAIDQNGNTATATTNANGEYSLNITSCTGQVRLALDVEGFNASNSNPHDDIFTSFSGQGNVTDVAFVDCGATNVNFGVNTPLSTSIKFGLVIIAVIIKAILINITNETSAFSNIL